MWLLMTEPDRAERLRADPGLTPGAVEEFLRLDSPVPFANIRAARRTVDRNLKRIQGATAANWEQVKRGVSQSVENLNESIEGAQPK